MAYDIKKDKNTLDYADFLLDKIINIESISDIAFINKCQIKKRLEILTLDDKYKSMKMLEKDSGNDNDNDNVFYKLSINLLIDKKDEARKIFEYLTQAEREEYFKFPIAIFLK